jgi:hypothetical protein
MKNKTFFAAFNRIFPSMVLTGNHMLWLAALRALADETFIQRLLSLFPTAEIEFLKYSSFHIFYSVSAWNFH